MPDCTGEFNGPLTRESECLLCGKALIEHAWISEVIR